MANCSSSSSPSGLQLQEDDIQKIVQALGSRLPAPTIFHVYEFSLGLLVAIGLTSLLFYRTRQRFLWRNREKEAVETLKNMDDETIKRMLGESNLPSWINFPDFERVGWINTVLSQLWPYISSAVSQQFREMLAPLLRENKPSWIASLKLFRFDLGDAAPQANGVKVYKSDENSGEIMIEVDFSWVGNQDVQLTIKPIPKHLGPLSPAGHVLSSIIRLRAGIERIIVNGHVRFMWKPLLGELPIIGGMQVALVDMPKFSFDVTLYGGNASMVPGLEQWLTTFMKDSVFRPYILPERYTVSFTEEGEEEELRPKGILFLRIIEAKHVPKMDIFSQSDPFVRMFVRHAIQLRTSVKQNNAHPSWDENFKFLIHDVQTQELTCVLMDYDDYNPDDEIGRCSLALRDLKPEVTQEFWLEVDTSIDADNAANPDGKGKGAGLLETLIEVEQKIANQGEKVWKKLPGINKKDRACQLHLEATLYMLDSSDLEAAARAEADKPQAQADNPEAVPRQSPPSSNGTEQHDPPSSNGNPEEAKQEVDEPGEEQAEVFKSEESPMHGKGGTPEGPKQVQPSGVSQIGEKQKAHPDVREEAVDALKGGVLYVKPRKGDSLVRKPWYKASFLHSTAKLEVSVCGHHKSTASARGSSPVFGETMEFLLGGRDIERAEHERLKIEVWDHRLHLNHFRGGCSIVLKEIIDAKRVKNTFRLSGVRHGELSLEVYWIPALETGSKAHKPMQMKAAEKD